MQEVMNENVFDWEKMPFFLFVLYVLQKYKEDKLE